MMYPVQYYKFFYTSPFNVFYADVHIRSPHDNLCAKMALACAEQCIILWIG